MHLQLQRYWLSSKNTLEPYFHRAGVKFPPKHLAFLVFKKSRRFEVYARDYGQWHYVLTIPVIAASGGPGPKLRRGDHQVPEGVYKIVGLNPQSRFDLSMHLNYPNNFDREKADTSNRRQLGGDIYIHGSDLSIGCIAIGNKAIQELFPLVYHVGINNVTVIISPNDLRYKKAVYGRVHPKWLSALYTDIKQELQKFPTPLPTPAQKRQH